MQYYNPFFVYYYKMEPKEKNYLQFYTKRIIQNFKREESIILNDIFVCLYFTMNYKHGL